MRYLTEFDKERNWKTLKNLLGTFQSGAFQPHLYPRCVIDDYAKQTLMSCVGYIAGIYRSGSIDLAGSMAHSLHECLEYVCLPSVDTNEQSILAFIGTDGCNLSLTFGLYTLLPEDGTAWGDENIQKAHNFRHVRFYGRRYWSLYYNGGIIFCAGGVRHWTLQAGDQPWSTHS